MPAIAVAVPLVVPAIDLGGPKVVRLYYCYSESPLFFALVCALGVMAASAKRLLMGLLVPRTPFELAVHLPQPVVPHFVLLPPRCLLFLTLSPLLIPPAHAGGLLGCLRGPVALPFLYLLLGGVLMQRRLFAGLGTSCGLAVSSPIPCNIMGIILTFVDLDTLSPLPPCQLWDMAGAHSHVVVDIFVP